MKLFTRLLIALLLTPFAAYGVALLVNLKDAEPSAAAQKLQAQLDGRPAISDGDNAYVYASGFEAALDESPLERGRAWLDWVASEGNNGDYANPPGNYLSPASDRAPRHQPLARDPGEAMVATGEALADWLATEDWLLERYRGLTALPSWHGEIVFGPAVPFMPFQSILDGQALMFAEARLAADASDASAVRSLLQRDLGFWRIVLAESDLLITKMIAVAAIRRHFEAGNTILRRLADSSSTSDTLLPQSWQQPLSPRELSLTRVLAAEWAYGMQIVADMQRSVGFKDPIAMLTWPLFQRQDSANRHAARLAMVAEALEVPIAELPGVTTELRSRQPASGSLPRLYNFAGWLILEQDAAIPQYADYAERVADLEGARRAVLKAALLREGTVSVDELHNPYTGAELGVTAGAVEFTGLAEGERGQFRFLL